MNTLINILATHLNFNNISCNTCLYFNQTALIFTDNERSQYVTLFPLYCCFGSSSSNLQNQITNNLSSLTTVINLRIHFSTLYSALSSYDTTATINTDNEVINLSGSSGLGFDTYNISVGIYRKDVFYDISNASS